MREHMCICIQMCMYVLMCHVCVCIHTRVSTCMHACVCMGTCVHTCACVCVCACMLACLCAFVCVWTQKERDQKGSQMIYKCKNGNHYFWTGPDYRLDYKYIKQAHKVSLQCAKDTKATEYNHTGPTKCCIINGKAMKTKDHITDKLEPWSAN